jgi:hypothetical protein
MAEELMKSGMDYSPVGSWTQGLARMANALMGGIESGRADKQDAELRAETKKEQMARQLLEDSRYDSETAYRHGRDTKDDEFRLTGRTHQWGREATDDSHWNQTFNKPDWGYVAPTEDAWGNPSGAGYWANRNSATAPQGPQLGQPQQQPMPQAQPQMQPQDQPSFEQEAQPQQVQQPQAQPVGMAQLAQKYLPGISPKIIMGNQDLQEFLASKASNPNDTRDFPTWDLERKKAPSSTTNIDMKGLSAEEESAGKGRGERMDTLESGASIKGLQQITLASHLLEGIDTDALSGLKGSVGSIAAAIGVPVNSLSSLGIDPELVTTGPEIQSLINRSVVSMIGSGQFPAQNFSDTDRIFLEKIFPSLTNLPQANKLIGATAGRLMEIENEKRHAWAQARKSGQTFRDFEITWNDTLAARDIFGDIAAQAQAFGGQQPLGETGSDADPLGIRVKR